MNTTVDSDGALAAYLLDVARKATSPTAVRHILDEGGVVPTTNTSATEAGVVLDRFASDLYERCNCRADESTKRVMTNADVMRRAANYDLVEYENSAVPLSAPVVAVSDKTYSDKRGKRRKRDRKDSKREKQRNSDGDGDRDVDGGVDNANRMEDNKNTTDIRTKPVALERRRHRRRSNKNSSDDDSEDGLGDVKKLHEERMEARRAARKNRHPMGRDGDVGGNGNEDGDLDRDKSRDRTGDGAPKDQCNILNESLDDKRDHDLKERDSFAKRLLDRDRKKDGVGSDGNAKKLAEREEDEMRLARGERVTDRETGEELSLSRLREVSRREYLKKRTERELTLLDREIAEEEQEFGKDLGALTE